MTDLAGDVRRKYEALFGLLEELVPAIGEERAAELLASCVERIPGFDLVHDEVLALLRTALAHDAVVEGVAGRPRRVLTDEDVMTPDELLSEARITGEAHRRVLQEELLDGSAVSRLLGSRSTNLRQYANTMRRRGDLIGVPHRNQYLYPAFQLDVDRRRLDPVVQDVNRLLGADDDPWGAASWWLSPNDRIGGRAPKDCLGEPEERSRLPAIAGALSEPLG